MEETLRIFGRAGKSPLSFAFLVHQPVAHPEMASENGGGGRSTDALGTEVRPGCLEELCHNIHRYAQSGRPEIELHY
jgi:hypothetical protein